MTTTTFTNTRSALDSIKSAVGCLLFRHEAVDPETNLQCALVPVHSIEHTVASLRAAHDYLEKREAALIPPEPPSILPTSNLDNCDARLKRAIEHESRLIADDLWTLIFQHLDCHNAQFTIAGEDAGTLAKTAVDAIREQLKNALAR